MRRELGVRTLFNVLGPLTNPAGARRQLMGVYSADLVEPIARVLLELGSEHALVVHGEDGLDEITTTGPTRVAEARAGEVRTYTIEPTAFGLPLRDAADLAGGEPAENAEKLERVLDGEPGALAEVTVLKRGGSSVRRRQVGQHRRPVSTWHAAFSPPARRARSWISCVRSLASQATERLWRHKRSECSDDTSPGHSRRDRQPSARADLHDEARPVADAADGHAGREEPFHRCSGAEAGPGDHRRGQAGLAQARLPEGAHRRRFEGTGVPRGRCRCPLGGGRAGLLLRQLSAARRL